MSENASTRERLKELIIEQLNLDGMTPDMIEEEAPLFGEGLGLDSVDALELVVALEKEWGLKIDEQSATREAFTSIATLADFVDRARGAG